MPNHRPSCCRPDRETALTKRNYAWGSLHDRRRAENTWLNVQFHSENSRRSRIVKLRCRGEVNSSTDLPRRAFRDSSDFSWKVDSLYEWNQRQNDGHVIKSEREKRASRVPSLTHRESLNYIFQSSVIKPADGRSVEVNVKTRWREKAESVREGS